MKMNIGDDGDIGRADNLFQRRRAFDIGAGYADDVDACILAPTDLINRGNGIAGQRIGHGLHRNRGIATDGDFADHDLAGRAARNVAPRANRRHRHDIGGLGISRNHHPELFSRWLTRELVQTALLYVWLQSKMRP